VQLPGRQRGSRRENARPLLETPFHRFLRLDEVKHLITACNDPTRTIVLLATMTGLRIGEILALRWKRINFIGETLVVAETCFMGHFGTPKTRASRREVPLSPAVVEALARSPWEQKSWGAIAPGNFADLVLLEANPVESIRNTETIWRVSKAG